MDFAILAVMIGCAIYNVYGIIQVGPDNASGMQWGVSVIMIVLVVARIFRMTAGKNRS